MSVLITREEHQRRQRRRRRQLIGLAVVVMVVFGVLYILEKGVETYKKVTDNTQEMLDYEKKLSSVVMYDPAYFTGLENAGSSFVQETSIWGTIYDMVEKGQWEGVERSEDERAILPGVDVSAFAAKLYGPSAVLIHKTFTDDYGLEYVYDEALQGYLVPVTSFEDSYSPSVVDLQKRAGKLRVTVGYIRNAVTGVGSAISESKPQKYADYIFERGLDRQWYLTGIEESSWKAQEGDIIQEQTVGDLAYDPTSALQQQLDQDETIETEPTPAPEE